MTSSTRTAFGAFALVAAAACFAIAEEPSAPSSHAPTAFDEPAVGNPEDYEVLRRLLGVAPIEPVAPGPAPTGEAVQAEPQASPQAKAGDEAAPPADDAPAAMTAPPSAKPSRAAAPPRPVAKKAAPRKPVAAARPAVKPAAAPAGTEARGAEGTQAAARPAPTAVVAEAAIEELPPTGSVLRAGDIERWQSLLGPSVQWSLLRGAALRIGERKPIPVEEARAIATQRYHAQVTLTPDRRDMRNYVAGTPFPLVADDDPDAGVKIVFNQQTRLAVDDMDVRKMGCEIASISPQRGMQLERTFQIAHWRRLYYVGRLYHPPVPSIPNQEGIRYRELQYPLIEPFDLKGGGWNYIRYTDVDRPDDGWLYYPVMRRVRRLSTAQRSQGIFGQDMDLDSYTGYAGNPAWMQWRLVGRKTMLVSMHAEHVPVKWQAPPADFVADEPWEPREVYVIEGRSLLPEYAFARRVIYVDRESWLVAYSEIYDDRGKLWKALHQSWGFGTKVRDDAGGRSFEEFYLPGYSMIDMQIDHVTRCELPLRTAVGDKGWYLNYGEREGTVESAFDIAGFLGETR